MSEARDPRPGGASDGRPPEARAADHAAIDRLAGELLPALVAKLTATGLGEIEVREDGWKVRLRRPLAAQVAAGSPRRAADRPSRSQPGHEHHGHAPGALEGHRSARAGGSGFSTNGTNPAGVPVGPGQPDGESAGRDGPGRAVATSPAVGVFRPRPDAGPGSRVRAGDRIGIVDLLGVPQDVVAPADGIVTEILAEAGEPVEYGQELVAVEPTSPTGGRGA